MADSEAVDAIPVSNQARWDIGGVERCFTEQHGRVAIGLGGWDEFVSIADTLIGCLGADE